MKIKMKTKLVCPECGSKITKSEGQYFCEYCRNEYFKSIDDDGNDTLIFLKALEDEPDTTKDPEKNVLRIITVVSAVIVFVLVVLGISKLFGGVGNFGTSMGNDSDTVIKEILSENGYSEEYYEVEHEIDLPSGIGDLPSGDNNKLLLLSNNGQHSFIVVNTEEESVTVPEFGFIPLNVVQEYIWGLSTGTNMECLDLFESQIERYGIHCMTTQSYAESYLRKLTENNIISVSEAQSLIENSTMQIFPSISSNDEVVVIFEKDSAVPAYYTTKSTQMVYNWGSLWPEYQYEFVVSSLDNSTLSSISYMYGPPYVQKTVWAVVDNYMNEVGVYNSLDEIKRELLN